MRPFALCALPPQNEKPLKLAPPVPIRLVTHPEGAECGPDAPLLRRVFARVTILIILTMLRSAGERHIDPICQNDSAVNGTALKGGRRRPRRTKVGHRKEGRLAFASGTLAPCCHGADGQAVRACATTNC